MQPVDMANGECSMALLLLWEVEHGGAFQAVVADRAGVLSWFPRRLLRCVAGDDELKLWLDAKVVQRPLAPGLP